MNFKAVLKAIIPSPVKRLMKNIYFSQKASREGFLISGVEAKQKKALSKIKQQKRVKIAFFVIHSSVWKYELLYRLLERHATFEPIIVVCPYTARDQETMQKEMADSFEFFTQHGYQVTKTFDQKNGEWLNVRKVIQPDLVFFTNPYNLTKKEYYITSWLDKLTFYVPYGFMITNRPQMQYDQLLHNLVFKIFYESNFQKKQAIKFGRNKGRNGVATGYPGLDEFLFPKRVEDTASVWKIADPHVKKIIWAPHHSIEPEETAFNYSNFLTYAIFMQELLGQYRNRIQVAFKPHPILKSKLYKHADWGKVRTDEYYSSWKNVANGQLEEGTYVDLFLTSDAMIHDSGSFLVEYISTNKPSLYMVRNEENLNGFTALGNEVLSSHYQSFDKERLVSFIENVINNQDPLKEKREQVIQKYLLPPNSNPSSVNIFNEIMALTNAS